MRAWLLLLAVLATFQPIVQVASTEDITSRFIQAISPPTRQQHQQQQPEIEHEDSRDARRTFNTQQSAETQKSANVTAVSQVIDITSLSVTSSSSTTGGADVRSRKSSAAATAIGTIFDSVSDNSDNNNNNLNKISAKDYRENKSENTSDALKAEKGSEVVNQKHKSHKQIQNQNRNHNEVNEKSAINTLEENSTKQQNSAVRTLANQANKVQQLQNINNNQEKITAKTKNNSSGQEENSVVNSEKEEQDKLAENLSKMAIIENAIESEEHSSKRHTHRRQHQQHQRHHHHQHQHQHEHSHQPHSHQQPHQHHKKAHVEAKAMEALSATKESLAMVERLATAEETPAAHKEAAEKLAQDSATARAEGGTVAPESTSATQSPSAIVSFSAAAYAATSSSSAASSIAADTDDDDNGDDSASDSEPATYSNKEIIGEKLKPDPSTLVQIENSLLSLFDMKRPPKIDRSKIIIPEAMKQLYAQIMGHELDSVMIPRPGILTKSANTVRSFTHIESKIDDRFPHHHRFRLYFDVKSIPTEEKLKAAELQLSRNAIDDAVLNAGLANRTRYQVLVYDITRVGVRGKREPSYLLLDNKAVHLNCTKTVSLDVQPAVDRWLATPKKNYGLLIEVRTSPSLKLAPHHHVRLRRSADEPHESWQHKQPVLYTYTDDGKHKSRSIRDVSSRSKRAGHHRRAHRRKNSDEICRRHSLYVDFADVGWSDWIVAPPGYDAFYCQGKCPFPLAEHMNSTNHAVVQTLVNNLNPGKVPKACCVPTQLEGISMLYLNDQNTVVLKNYQDMTVVGCGCR